MPYGTIKVDNITFTNGGTDETTTVSGIYKAITSGLTVSGTISGTTIQGQTISGVTVTGTTAQFTNITGGSIGATTITGTTVTGTTANFVSGVFTTQISGATVTGTTANFTSGNFTALSGASTTVTSGIFAVGSASAPSISFASDPNTGIYSPGADQVAISTGGTGRLFVDAAGDVGLGVVPTGGEKLTVNGNIGVGGNLIARGPVEVMNSNFVYLYNTGSSTYWDLRNNSNSLTFRYNASEAMRLDSSGRLGLGTSAPTGGGLNVSSDTTPGIVLQRTTTTANQNDIVQILRFLNGSAASNYSADILSYQSTAFPDAVGLQFRTKNGGTADPTTRLTINGAGNVGIGTTGPLHRLDISGASARLNNGTNASTDLYFGPISAVGNYSYINWNNTVGSELLTLYTDGGGMRFSTAGSERARIDSSGRVGIGTTAPASMLHLARSFSPSIRLDNTSTNYWEISNDSNLIFDRGGTERIRFDASGRLLVGTSSARSNFFNTSGISPAVQIEGTDGNISRFSSVVFNSNDTNGPYYILGKTRSTTTGGNTVVVSGDYLGTFSFQGSDGTELVQAAEISCAVDGTPGANDMPGRLVFSTTADGAASPTERMRIDSSGRVGIGTTSPSFELDLGKDSATQNYTQRIITGGSYSAASRYDLNGIGTFTVGFNNSGGVVNNAPNGAASLWMQQAYPIVFGTNGSERARIDSSGRLLVGTSATTGGAVALLQVQGYSGGSTGVGLLELKRGAAVPANGDELGRIDFSSSNSERGAVITTARDGGTWTAGSSHPGRLVFSTTADGSANPTERMRIDSTGQIEVASLGTAAAPVYSFFTDQNTGIYSPAADQVSISTNGTAKALVDDTTAPIKEVYSSIFYPIVTQVDIGTDPNQIPLNGYLGTMAFQDSAAVAMGTASVDLGSAAAPSINFTGDSNTGIYSPGADQLAVATNGVQRVTVDTAATTSTLPIVHPLGAVGTPSITFTGDLNSGFWSPTADTLAASTAGSERARIDSSGRLLVGTSTARAAVSGITPQLQIEGGNSSSAALSIIIDDNSAIGSSIYLGKSRGATLGSATIVANGDDLGTVLFTGADGTALVSAAKISAQVDGTPGTNDMPGRLVFSTTADGAASPTERMRIDNAGRVGIGTSSPSYLLDVSGGDASIYSVRIGRGPGASAFNTVVGNGAFNANTTGDSNTAVGYQALLSNTTGNSNIGIGQQALRVNTTGSFNVAIGVSALSGFSGGSDNTACGTGALANTSGGTNTAVGSSAGNGVTSGAQNALLGYLAGQSLTSGSNNTIIGSIAGTAGLSNTVIIAAGTTERLRIDSNGTLLVAGSTATSTYSVQGAGLQTATAWPYFFNNGNGYLGPVFWKSVNNTLACELSFVKTRGAAIGSQGLTLASDPLGYVNFIGSDGSNTYPCASIQSYAEANVSSTSSPGRIVFGTTTASSVVITEKLRINSNGFTTFTGTIGRGAPVTKTGNFTLAITENWIICNGTATITVTLPAASSWTGREVMLKTIAAFTVVSASSNVVPLAGGAAATAILAATAGKYATLVSDGTNWIIMQAN